MPAWQIRCAAKLQVNATERQEDGSNLVERSPLIERRCLPGVVP